jgi:uncharacterized membrane protein YgcG
VQQSWLLILPMRLLVVLNSPTLLSQATFLPSGYPHTVAPHYLRNTLWQAVHHTCGSVNGVLASTFLLYSVGLGAGAVPTAGALNWVLKDGLGQLGTLLFGKAIAHNFDVSSRAWYLLASAKLNLAMGLEICTFLMPAYFLPIGAVANAIKGLSWMAGGSTKSVFKVSFAADNNFGDVSAKATSQTICASVVGTSCGVAMASQVGQNVGIALACYASLAAAHLWTGYKAVRCVPLATLNPSRLELLIQQYLAEVQQQEQQAQQAQQGGGSEAEQHVSQQGQAGSIGQRQPWCMAYVNADPQRQLYGYQQTAAMGQRAQQAAVSLPTPADLAPSDPVFHVPWLKVGTSLSKLVRQHGPQLAAVVQQQQLAEERQRQVQQADPAAADRQGDPAAEQRASAQRSESTQQEQQQQQEYQQGGSAPEQLHLLVPDGAGGMHLLLHEQAESADCILGFLHAYLVQECCSGGCGSNSGSSGGSGGSSGGGGSDRSAAEQQQQVQRAKAPAACSPTADQLAYSLAQARQLLPGLLTALEAAGWDDQKVVLEPKRRRVVW